MAGSAGRALGAGLWGLGALEALDVLGVLDVLGGFAYQRFSGKPLICPATCVPCDARLGA